jgi:hypothetical protein
VTLRVASDVPAFSQRMRAQRLPKIMNAHIRYKGYEVAPAAQQMPNGLFAANLTIENTSANNGKAYSFDALDYFFDEEHALAYAFRWGRMWIDNHQ